MILTKPVGVGIYSAAFKKEALSSADYADMLATMTSLNLIGADWQPLFVDFFGSGVQRTPAWRGDVNEMGEVPVLVHGTKKLTQSGVILTYLSEHSGKFLPRGDDERLVAIACAAERVLGTPRDILVVPPMCRA